VTSKSCGDVLLTHTYTHTHTHTHATRPYSLVLSHPRTHVHKRKQKLAHTHSMASNSQHHTHTHIHTPFYIPILPSLITPLSHTRTHNHDHTMCSMRGQHGCVDAHGVWRQAGMATLTWRPPGRSCAPRPQLWWSTANSLSNWG
jgi:hypothetical protein